MPSPHPPAPESVTFMMVGCQRCGTTWVDAALREHPAVYLPSQKQTYFFDRHYDRGISWYMSQFDGVKPGHTAVGEIATGYCLPHAVPRLVEHFPHIKLLMAMRHPVERAYSNFLSRRAERGWRSFEEAFDTDEDLRVRGHYHEQIQDLLAVYPRDRMLLLLYDDLLRDDRTYLADILAFIGVSDDFTSSLIGQRKNAAGWPRFRSALHRVGLKPVLKTISRSPVGTVVRRLRRSRGVQAAQRLDPTVRSRVAAYYRPHNDALAAFLDRDLDIWNR